MNYPNRSQIRPSEANAELLGAVSVAQATGEGIAEARAALEARRLELSRASRLREVRTLLANTRTLSEELEQVIELVADDAGVDWVKTRERCRTAAEELRWLLEGLVKSAGLETRGT
jgi:hypothetical protein